MNSFTRDYRSLLTEEYEPPCVSIYFPTHRSSPEKLQDPIRFRNLIRQAEKDLQEKYPDANANKILAPFRELLEDDGFWNTTLDGVGLLGSAGKVEVYPLKTEVGEEVLVADRFYTRPLMSIFEPAGNYHVLGLELHRIKLFEGDRHTVREIDLGPDAPKTIEAALGDQLTQTYQSISSNARGTASTFHASGARMDEVDIDAIKYFRIVDRWIFENYSRPSGTPLILAALPEHHSDFRDISKNPLLEPEGIMADCSSLSPEEMIAKASEIVNHHRTALEEDAIKQYGFAYGRGNASEDIAEIARAVAEGRVATLLLESGRRVGGTIDEATGAVEYSDEPMAPDVLGQLGELVVRTSGDVLILPADRMPVSTGVAGTFRY
ncbi:MAG: hypothetical protein HGA54_02380 [Actinobacteria bacterium]|nr:hypothetical protein [Actinomycetota bacterium]